MQQPLSSQVLPKVVFTTFWPVQRLSDDLPAALPQLLFDHQHQARIQLRDIGMHQLAGCRNMINHRRNQGQRHAPYAAGALTPAPSGGQHRVNGQINNIDSAPALCHARPASPG